MKKAPEAAEMAQAVDSLATKHEALTSNPNTTKRKRKRNSRALPFPFSPCEQEGVICEPGSRPSADTKPASTLILDFLDSRTVNNECCLSHPAQSTFVIAA
jgi:hypothetical protein